MEKRARARARERERVNWTKNGIPQQGMNNGDMFIVLLNETQWLYNEEI